MLAASWEEAQHSTCYCARAVPRWLRSVYTYGSALRRREASLLLRALVVRRVRCSLQRQASAACHAAQARRRSLSLEVRYSIRACWTHAPCCADCGRPVPQGRALRRREACFLRCAPVVRHEGCGLQRQASVACLARRRRTYTRFPWRGGAALKLVARARRAALVAVFPCLDKGHYVGEKLSPSARARVATC